MKWEIFLHTRTSVTASTLSSLFLEVILTEDLLKLSSCNSWHSNVYSWRHSYIDLPISIWILVDGECSYPFPQCWCITYYCSKSGSTIFYRRSHCEKIDCYGNDLVVGEMGISIGPKPYPDLPQEGLQLWPMLLNWVYHWTHYGQEFCTLNIINKSVGIFV